MHFPITISKKVLGNSAKRPVFVKKKCNVTAVEKWKASSLVSTKTKENTHFKDNALWDANSTTSLCWSKVCFQTRYFSLFYFSQNKGAQKTLWFHWWLNFEANMCLFSTENKGWTFCHRINFFRTMNAIPSDNMKIRDNLLNSLSRYKLSEYNSIQFPMFNSVK